MDAPSTRTRRLVAAVAAVLALATVLTGSQVHRAATADPADGLYAAGLRQVAKDCGDAYVVDAKPLGGPTLCAHPDEAPAGVDVTKPVSTATLVRRQGAARQATAAAEQAGIASPAAAAGATPYVPCNGDDANSYAVQGLYVVEAGRPNRYASLLPSFRLWAAGVDNVFNRSAALTGGVRHVRYVTDPAGGGNCVADVLDVTVPAGTLADFNTTISALAALGYMLGNRKYLIWSDATVLCGIATLYNDEKPTQDNANNGSYPEYARIDSGCWGLGSGPDQHSVEAHELTHTLGAVQNDAPHSTHAGHCWDQSDTMCYADGGTHSMVQLCPTDREYLLDCNSDDYYSTYPRSGTWLASHWNAADSRFLIGGGDGTDGGQLGTPPQLGAAVDINNPAIPGLATQVEAAPALPSGDAVASVRWTVALTGCALAAPARIQTVVTCPATATGATTVTAAVTDTRGATVVVTGTLTFATGTGNRPVDVTTGLDGQSGTAQTACTGTSAPVGATVVDHATGQPVAGLPVTMTQAAYNSVPTPVATATTDVAGRAGAVLTATAKIDLIAQTSATGPYGPGSADVRVTPQTCQLSLSGSAAAPAPGATGASGALTVRTGATLAVRGALVRDGGIPVAGTAVALVESVGGAPVVLGTATTAPDGSYTAEVRANADGDLTASVAATSGWAGVSTLVASLEVADAVTALAGTPSSRRIAFGTPIRVTGTLTGSLAGAATIVPGAVISIVNVRADGGSRIVARARTSAAGRWAAILRLHMSGVLHAEYPGALGYAPSDTSLGAVSVDTWRQSIRITGWHARQRRGAPNRITGQVSRSFDRRSGPAAGAIVLVYYRVTGGALRLVRKVHTSRTGRFAFRLRPYRSGTFVLRAPRSAGQDAARPVSRRIRVRS